MKTLLPILKTKLFLLSFVSACTVILATTVPQIRNFIAPEKAIGEKITTEQKKITPKIKKQNKTVGSSRVTSGITLGMSNSFVATVQTDQQDYIPGQYVVITGSGWDAGDPGETVTLHIVSDCGCTDEILYATADANGNIENSEFQIQEWHLGASFILTATGLGSGQTAQTTFTDATWTLGVSPSTFCANDSKQVTFTVTQTSNASPKNESISITVPSGFTITSPSTPSIAGKSWSSSLTNSTTVCLSADPPGSSNQLSNNDVITFTATVTAGNTAGSFVLSGNGNGTTTCATSGGQSITSPPSFTVTALPSSTFTGTTTVCPSSSNIYSGPAGLTYAWSLIIPNGATISGNSTLQNVTVISGSGNNSSYTLKLITTDGNTCFSSSSQLITVADNTAPTITCPLDVTVQCSSDVPAVNIASVTAADVCSTPTVTHVGDVTSGQICDNKYTLTRKYKATDASGNTNTCAQVITVNDNTKPTVTAPSGTTVTCSGDVPAGILTYSDFVIAGGTASDNCTGAIAISFSDATTPGTCANKFTVARTYTATDVCGNTATSNQTITVNDNVAPTITAPSGTTVTCSGDVPAGNNTYGGFVTAGGTASDNCTGVIAISFSDATTPGTCANKFTVARTYKATDVCGNTATSNQTITVNDNVAPTITAPSGTTVTCSGDVPAGINTYGGFVTAGGTASDNCTGAIAISFSDATTPGTCANKFTVTRTYKATDVCGNTATSNQTITVNDNVAPTITAPSGTTVTCSGDVPAGINTYGGFVTAGGTASDNCTGVIAISFSDATTPGTCANKFTVTRTYKATDVCGNTATSNQTITVNDNVAPTITAPSGTTVTCSGDVPAGNNTYGGFVTAGGTASDNCTGAIAISFSDATTPGTCANKFTVTRTYKATDVCGNTATSNQTITVNDNVAPTVTAPSGTTVTCSGDVPAGILTYSDFVIAGGTASDNCTGAIAISFSDATTPGTCANKFTVARTYTATDVCGNTATSNQTITVNDNVAPTITAPSGTTVTCSGDVPAGNNTYGGFVTAGGTASDNCTGAIAISFSDATTPGTCANKFTVARTYKATDVCGNTATSNQTITVNDNVAPTITAPSGTTVTCSGDVPAGINTYGGFVTAGGTASDNCTGAIAISFSDATTPGTCANKFTVTRTYKATDVCGNTATSNQTITVNDNVAPTITAPSGTTVTCSGDVPAGINTYGGFVTAGGTASDNCTGVIAISFSDATTPGTCANKFTVTRTYKATDVCGNTATSNQTITVNDNVAPTITAPSGTTVTCSGDVPAGNNTYGGFVTAGGTASDNCTGAIAISFSDATTPGTCANKFTVTRTYKATDVCGNTATSNQTITVNDNVAPTVTAPSGTTVTCSGDVPAGILTYSDFVIAGGTASDNCTGAIAISFSDATTPGTCANKFTVARTYTATDVCGNTATSNQTITVNDNVAPTITAPSGTTVTCSGDVPAGNNTYGGFVTAGGTASDNCTGVIAISFSDATTPGTCANKFTVARTYKATDVCGNTATSNQTITVNDNVAPTITAPSGTTVTCSGDVPAGINTYGGFVTAGGTASDNCTGAIAISFSDATTPGTCANKFTVTRTYKATDVCGNTATSNQTITVNDNVAPTITAPSGTTVTCSGDVPAGINTYGGFVTAGGTASDNCTGVIAISFSDATTPGTCANKFTVTRTYKATDVCGNTATSNQTITVNDNVVPVITSVSLDKTCLWPPNHKMVDIAITPTASDGCGSVAASIVVTSNEPANDIGDGNTEEDIAWTSGVVQLGDPYTVKGPITVGTDGKYHIQLRAERSGVNAETGRIYTIYFTATDACGNTATAPPREVTVAHNITNPGPGNAVEINTTINLAGTFWDVPGKTHTAKWVVDGTTINGIVTAEPSGNKMGKVTGSFKPTVAGVYKLRMNVTDQSGVTSYATTSGDYEAYFVAFDPKGGFTYGGGQFTSPIGALPARPNLTDAVTFGFASNYYKNATNPKGETQIDFKLTDGDYSFAFNALNYDYLVANGSNATYKGLGKTTINGVEQSGLAFILKVIDGKTATNPNGADKIRMKIYNKNTGAVIYDNQMGASETADPTTPVDQPKDDGTDIVVVSNPATTTNITTQNTQMETVAPDITKFNVRAFPNPSEHVFSLVLENATNEKVQITVYDATGRQVKMFEKQSGNIPIHFGMDLKAGVYVVEVRQGDNRKTLKLVKQ